MTSHNCWTLGLITLAKVILDHLENNVAKQTWHMSTCQTSSPIVLDVLVCITFTKHFLHLATAIRVRLANQSAVLVTGGGSESTLRSGAVTLWHITWAAALAVALGTAEISGQSLNSDGLLVRFAASLWVAVVSGVGCHGHLQQRRFTKKNVTYHNRQNPSKLIGPSVCLK